VADERDDVCGVVGVSGLGMFGVVMLRPPHLMHLGVSPATDVAEADWRETVVPAASARLITVVRVLLLMADFLFLYFISVVRVPGGLRKAIPLQGSSTRF